MSQLAVRLGIDAYSLILVLILLGVIRARFCTIGFPALLLRLGLNQHTFQVLDGTYHQGLLLRLFRRVQLEEAKLPTKVNSVTTHILRYTRAFRPYPRERAPDIRIYVILKSSIDNRAGNRNNRESRHPFGDPWVAVFGFTRASISRQISRRVRGMRYSRKRENGVSRLRTSALSNAFSRLYRDMTRRDGSQRRR